MKQWVYPYPVKMVELSGKLSLAYIDVGKGDKVLLFIHGLGSNIKGWKKNIDELKDHYRCIAVDLPGYGKSSKGDYPFGMEFFRDVLQEFITKINLDIINIIGHSMGGQIALKWTIQNDISIDKLILLAPAGIEQFSDAEKLRIIRMTRPHLLEKLSLEQINRNFRINFHQMPKDALFMVEDRLLLREDKEYHHFCKMVSLCIRGMLEDPDMADLNKVRVPTLLMYGKEDLLIPNRMLHPEFTTELIAEQGRDDISGSILKMIDGAGHFLQWEQFNTVNNEITHFIG